jgi:hypothetical protein
MKPRTERPNVFEIRARAAKCDALVAEINRITEQLGVKKSLMLNAVAVWGNREWSELALQIGRRPPSPDTRNAVLAVLSRAALVERLAEDTEPYFSSDRDSREVTP